MNKSSYKLYTKNHADTSPSIKNLFFSFIIGGMICVFGELLFNIYKTFIESAEDSKLLVSVTLIFITCLLSGIGIFDKIAKVAGAGTLVPITGFANAVVSPAIDYTAEGLIMGIGAKMFIIAGPVIVYGTVFSTVYGIIYYFFGG